MSELQFHSVDPESLKIGIETILAPSSAAVEQAIYDIPVPTEDQTLPHAILVSRSRYQTVDDKLHRTKPNLIDQYRGRLGGC